MGEQTAKIGSLLRELIISVFSDFEKGKSLIKQISDIRREVRAKEYDLLNLLFTLGLVHTDFYYFHDIINSLTSTVNISEEFSDDIFGLICKYTLG
jgi:hypothetical protein